MRNCSNDVHCLCDGFDVVIGRNICECLEETVGFTVGCMVVCAKAVFLFLGVVSVE